VVVVRLSNQRPGAQGELLEQLRELAQHDPRAQHKTTTTTPNSLSSTASVRSLKRLQQRLGVLPSSFCHKKNPNNKTKQQNNADVAGTEPVDQHGIVV
jgi:hypothetical protein